MLRYAITDRHSLGKNEPEQQRALIALAREWAQQGVDFVQIREKDMSAEELRNLAHRVISVVRAEGGPSRVLLNGPAEIALDSGADGVHLPANVSFDNALVAREIFAKAGRDAILSFACHSPKDVLRLREESQRDPLATIANTVFLYAPVFGKTTATETLPGLGLESLRAAVKAAKNIPVFALGGINKDNALSCIAVGAAGVAGIRFFQGADPTIEHGD